MEGKCELCHRQNIGLTKHHLLPREEGGKEEHIAYICEDCHKHIHALYTNRELAIRLSTIQDLQADDKICKYLKFIRKQPSSKKVRSVKSNERRKSR
ncbi:MAG: HNH endonuclease [Lachnospiraceae bacterium]|nr:HNH endonuclease [Lachnospiraceae bacterium]